MRAGATERFDRHKRMRSGNFPRPTRATTLATMASQLASQSRAENSADLLRVVVALGLLALLASFDGANDAPAAASSKANTETAADLPQ
jgi:hypothetical protein